MIATMGIGFASPTAATCRPGGVRRCALGEPPGVVLTYARRAIMMNARS